MADINPVWTETLELLAFQSLGAGAAVHVPIDQLSTQDIAEITILFNEGNTVAAAPNRGLRVSVYGANDLTGIGTDGPTDGLRQQFTIPVLDSRLETTVDADSSSGQKVLNVTATTNAAIGRAVIIAAADATREEIGRIVSISAGASVTLARNLVNTHTAAQADSVEECQIRSINIEGVPGASLLLENLDTTNAVEVAVFGATRDWQSV